MTSTVPQYRNVVDVSRVRGSSLVRAPAWNGGAQLANWLGGRGNMEIPVHFPDGGFDGGEGTFHYRIKPRYQTTRYALSVWVVTFDLSEAEARFELTVGGTTYNGTAHYPWRPPAPLTVMVDRSAQDSAETDFSFTIGPAGSTYFMSVYAASLEALPRYQLLAADGGSDATIFGPGLLIGEENVADALSDQVDLLRDSCRRAAFHHSWGNLAPFTTSSTSFVTAISSLPILGRRIHSDNGGEITLNSRVRAYCSDGSTSAEIQVSNSSGGGAVFTVPTSSTSAAWFPSTAGAAATFTCYAEDNTAADGLQSSIHDEHTVEVRRTAGAGSVRLESISIWEP